MRENRWGGRLRLIPILDEHSGEYVFRELSEHIPMPRTGSKIYELGEDLFATGVNRGVKYLDVLNVSDFNSNNYEWGPWEDSPKNREIYSGLRNMLRGDDYDDEGPNIREILNLENEIDEYNDNSQGAD